MAPGDIFSARRTICASLNPQILQVERSVEHDALQRFHAADGDVRKPRREVFVRYIENSLLERCAL